MQEYQNIIEQAWEDRASLSPGMAPAKIGEAVDFVIDQLDSGKLRVAEKIDGQWVTHQWLKKAVLLSFRLNDNVLMEGGETRYFDKVPSKFASYDREQFVRGGFRVVPPAAARRGAYIAKNVVLMPSFCNIGARVDEGTPRGSVFIPFAFYEAAANRLTNPALDPFGKIPEFKYCAVKVTRGGDAPVQSSFGGGQLLAREAIVQ